MKKRRNIIKIVLKTTVDLKTNIALLAYEDESRKENIYILDSGAIEHMTSDRKKNLKS